MKSLFLITLGAGFNRADVIAYLSSLHDFGMWFYSMPNSFFIYSKLSATAIGKLIEEYFGEKERYFVVCISESDGFGRMPKEHWDIVNDHGAERKFELKFSGYYLSEANLPHTPGIYCVYRCRAGKEENTVTLLELLYIGKAKNIYTRHEHHEKKKEWLSAIQFGEQLCFSCAETAEDNLERCEAALIFLNQPRCNSTGKDSFPYFDTLVVLSGTTALLKTTAIAEQTK